MFACKCNMCELKQVSCFKIFVVCFWGWAQSFNLHCICLGGLKIANTDSDDKHFSTIRWTKTATSWFSLMKCCNRSALAKLDMSIVGTLLFTGHHWVCFGHAKQTGAVCYPSPDGEHLLFFESIFDPIRIFTDALFDFRVRVQQQSARLTPRIEEKRGGNLAVSVTFDCAFLQRFCCHVFVAIDLAWLSLIAQTLHFVLRNRRAWPRPVDAQRLRNMFVFVIVQSNMFRSQIFLNSYHVFPAIVWLTVNKNDFWGRVEFSEKNLFFLLFTGTMVRVTRSSTWTTGTQNIYKQIICAIHLMGIDYWRCSPKWFCWRVNLLMVFERLMGSFFKSVTKQLNIGEILSLLCLRLCKISWTVYMYSGCPNHETVKKLDENYYPTDLWTLQRLWDWWMGNNYSNIYFTPIVVLFEQQFTVRTGEMLALGWLVWQREHCPLHSIANAIFFIRI